MSEEVRITAPTLPIAYNVAIEGIEGEDENILIDWGNTPGWVDRLRPQLDAATRLSLIPKDPQGDLQLVTVQLGDGRRWILFSRVFGRFNAGSGEHLAAIRLYAIGWQATIGGRNVKSITWVYPNGAVEVGDEPTYAGLFLDAIQASTGAEEP